MKTAAMTSATELPTVETAVFKGAMRLLPSGVSVITSRHRGRMNGMTATSVTSASAEPPLVLSVINQSNRSHELIASGGAYAVNILSEGQDQIARYFASKTEKSFNGIAHRIGLTGCPLIEGCAVSLELSLHDAHDLGTHTLFIGRVVHVATTDRPPLIYHNGSFGYLAF